MTDDLKDPSAQPRPVLASRISILLGATAFAAVVTSITWAKSHGTLGGAGMAMLIYAIVAGMAAIALGLLGVAQARRLLVPGILFGMLGILLGAITSLGAPLTIWAVKHSEAIRYATPSIKATKQWIMLVGSGNISGAKAMSRDPIDETKLTEAFEQIQSFGVIRTVDEFFGGEVHDEDDVEIQARIEFDKGAKVVVTHWDATGGSPILTDFEFRDDPKAPATTQAK